MAPGKMLCPLLLTGIKDHHDSTTIRVQARDLRSFGPVTSAACPGQIVQRCITAKTERLNMLAFIRLNGKPLRATTILAQTASPFG